MLAFVGDAFFSGVLLSVRNDSDPLATKLACAVVSLSNASLSLDNYQKNKVIGLER